MTKKEYIKRKHIFEKRFSKSKGPVKPNKVFDPILGKTDRYSLASPSMYHFMTRINITPKKRKRYKP